MSTAYGGDGITFPDNSVQATAPRVGMVNRIINGDMRIDQRNAGASVTSTAGYTLDRWLVYESTDGAISFQQVSDAPSGFSTSLKATTTTADSSLGATQYCYLEQRIEGYNFSDLGFGTASAQNVTLSFQVKSSLTGTFGGVLMNSANNRCYPFTYTINAANTWETKSVTVAGDTTGTWVGATNGIGIRAIFGLGLGSTYSGTAGAWAGSELYAPTGAVPLIGTLNATWQITGVQLEKGSTATDFEYVDYGRQLQMCQRYYQNSFPAGTAPFSPASPTGSNVGLYTWKITMVSSGYGSYYTLPLIAPMRSSPSIVGYNGGNNNNKVRHMPAAVDFTVTSVTAFSNTGFVLFFYGGAGDGTGSPVGWNWSASAEL